MVTKQTPLSLAPAPVHPIGVTQLSRTWPRLLPIIGAALLGLSLVLPYWTLTLHAPQYPKGLSVTLSVTKLTGDVDEIDGLNHYIGMMKLGDAAVFERRIALLGIGAIVIFALLAAALRSRWAALLALPLVAFPFVFAGDLYYWLYRAGHDLDPHAALSTSIKPFTPAILGVGKVGQFSTTARFDLGFYLGLLAAVLAIVSIVTRLRRRTA